MSTGGPHAGDPQSSGFAAALARAIERRGLSLTMLVRRLADSGNPVSRATLSYWRTGERTPEGVQSMGAIAELERMLELAPDALLALVPDGRRVGPVRAPVIPVSEAETRAIVAETMAVLDADPQSSFREVTTHIVADVGEDGGVTRIEVRTVIQATSGTVSRLPVAEFFDEPPTEELRVEAIAGCEVTMAYRHPSGRAMGYVITLDRPITARESALLEYATNSPLSERMHGHLVAREIRHLVLWVRFPRGAVPATYVEWEGEGDLDAVPGPPQPIVGTSIFVERRGWGPGEIFVRW
jgi:hypothetical protein